MRVLVIPDIHLKPWIFSRAAELMKENVADQAVCLMDIADECIFYSCKKRLRLFMDGAENFWRIFY